jgi:hypothetical protein
LHRFISTPSSSSHQTNTGVTEASSLHFNKWTSPILFIICTTSWMRPCSRFFRFLNRIIWKLDGTNLTLECRHQSMFAAGAGPRCLLWSVSVSSPPSLPGSS